MLNYPTCNNEKLQAQMWSSDRYSGVIYID